MLTDLIYKKSTGTFIQDPNSSCGAINPLQPAQKVLPPLPEKPYFPPKKPLPEDAAELCALDPEFLQAGGETELDLGCARGHFLVAVAAENPEVRYLGIDFQLSRIRETRRKIARHGLANAAAVRGEILETIVRHVPARSVRRIHLLFPDPWPKRRHASRRLFQATALEVFSRSLRPGGELRFLTDDEPYFHQALKLVQNNKGWELSLINPLAGWSPTEFQSRFVNLGLPIYGLVAKLL